MNLTHVLAFHRVAAAGSYTLAARLSGVSQPTLSAQVRALERMAGHALFVRAGRGIRLTPEGEALYAATARLAEALDGVAEVLAVTRAPAGGHLRVTADSAVHVIPILAEMKRRTDGFTFSIRIENSAGVIAHVLGEEADVGVMARAVEDPRLHVEPLRVDRIVLLVPREHAWAAHGRIKLSGLAGADLVMRERGSSTRAIFEARLGAQRVRPQQAIEVETRQAVGEAVAAGLGVGVVFASEAMDDARLVQVAIADAEIVVSEYVVCRAERRRLGLVGRFFETARRTAAERGWLG